MPPNHLEKIANGKSKCTQLHFIQYLHIEGQLSSLSAVNMDAEPSPALFRKPPGRAQRHQSLYVPPSQEYSTGDVDGAATENHPLISVRHRILKLLADKRAKGGRPEEINVKLLVMIQCHVLC